MKQASYFKQKTQIIYFACPLKLSVKRNFNLRIIKNFDLYLFWLGFERKATWLESSALPLFFLTIIGAAMTRCFWVKIDEFLQK